MNQSITLSPDEEPEKDQARFDFSDKSYATYSLTSQSNQADFGSSSIRLASPSKSLLNSDITAFDKNNIIPLTAEPEMWLVSQKNKPLLGTEAITPAFQSSTVSLNSNDGILSLKPKSDTALVVSSSVNHGIGVFQPVVMSHDDYLKPILTTPKPLGKEEIISIIRDAMKEGAKEGSKATKEVISEAIQEIVAKLKDKEREYNLSYTDRVIHFCGKDIPIPEDTDMERLCRTLFRNKICQKKLWNCDEIVELWGEDPGKKTQMKVYHAASGVNKKVAVKTAIENLLTVTTKSVVINQSYIK